MDVLDYRFFAIIVSLTLIISSIVILLRFSASPKSITQRFAYLLILIAGLLQSALGIGADIASGLIASLAVSFLGAAVIFECLGLAKRISNMEATL
jgi:hypothetical protein